MKLKVLITNKIDKKLEKTTVISKHFSGRLKSDSKTARHI